MLYPSVVFMVLHFLVGSFQQLDKDETGTAEMNLSEVLWLDFISQMLKQTIYKTLISHSPFVV